MKKRELDEYRTKTAKELEKRIGDLRAEISKSRVETLSGKEKNTRKTKMLRHELAQMLTVKTENLKKTKKKK